MPVLQMLGFWKVLRD